MDSIRTHFSQETAENLELETKIKEDFKTCQAKYRCLDGIYRLTFIVRSLDDMKMTQRQPVYIRDLGQQCTQIVLKLISDLWTNLAILLPDSPSLSNTATSVRDSSRHFFFPGQHALGFHLETPQ